MINPKKDEKKEVIRDSLFRYFVCNYWTNPIVVDEFTNIDKMLYPYLLTNPHSNLLGCYQISKKYIQLETEYDVESISKSLKHMEELNFLKYDETTKEILLFEFIKDNWNKSDKYLKGLSKQLNSVKSKTLFDELTQSLNNTNYAIKSNGINRLSIEYIEGIDSNNKHNSNPNDTRNRIKNSEEEQEEEKELAQEKSIKELSTKDKENIAKLTGTDVNKIYDLYDKIKFNDFTTDEGVILETNNDFIFLVNEIKERELSEC